MKENHCRKSLAEHAEEIEKVRQYTITEFEKTKRY